MNPGSNTSDSERTEVDRTASEVADRLRTRGVTVLAGDGPDDLVTLLESVEAFEVAVQTAGGDLMVDEPPAGSEPQPDDTRFVLPARGADESVPAYIDRVAHAADVARGPDTE